MVSIFSCLFAMMGIAALVGKKFVGGIIFIAIGAGGLILADKISGRKAQKTAFKKWYDERGTEIDGMVRSSEEIARKLYNSMPTAEMLKYIEGLNQEAAAAIRAERKK